MACHLPGPRTRGGPETELDRHPPTARRGTPSTPLPKEGAPGRAILALSTFTPLVTLSTPAFALAPSEAPAIDRTVSCGSESEAPEFVEAGRKVAGS